METQLHYTNWRELDSHLIWIYQGVPIRMRGRFVDQQQAAWFILRGSLQILGDESSREVCAGNWVFTPTESLQRVFSDDAEIISVKFSLCWPDNRMLYRHVSTLVASGGAYPELERSARPLLAFVQKNKLLAGNQMQYEQLDYRTYLQVNRLYQNWLIAYVGVMEALRQVPHISRHEDERILKAKSVLDGHPFQQPLDLQQLAARVGLSLGHADVLFRENFGATMRGYLDQRRFRAGLHRLETTNQPIKAIAFELGFQDATALTHWFKKKAGLSPSQYRKLRLSSDSER